MAGITTAQSIRFAELDDVISADITKLTAQDIARELDAVDAARLAATKLASVSIWNTSGQTIPVAGVGTVMTYTNELWDTHGMVNLGTNNSRAVVGASSGTGLYYVQAETGSHPSSWSVIELTIRKNGLTQVRRKYWNNAGNTVQSPMITGLVWLGTIGDYVDVVCYHEGGGSDLISFPRLKMHKRTAN